MTKNLDVQRELETKIKYCSSTGDAQKHIFGDDHALNMIYGMLAFNAKTYRFTADLTDKQTGADKGTYEVTVKKIREEINHDN